MAQMTPRLAWNNLFKLAATVVSSSSAAAAFPLRWLRDHVPSKSWRSPVGWNIVVSENDRLDITEATTGAFVVTLTAGNYVSGQLLAAELETQINAGASDNTYLVTYSSTTHKFTIEIDVGSTAFSLDLNSGANKARSVGPCIGFDEAADTAEDVNDKVSDNAVYLSQEWITFDLLTAQSVTAVLTYFQNFSANATVTIMGNATDAWTSPSFSDELEGTLGTDQLIGVNFAAQSYRYWRLLIEDQQNSDGYLEIGAIFGGPYLQPGRSVRRGYVEAREELSTISYADQGAHFVDVKESGRALSVAFPRLSKADKLLFDTMADSLKVGGAFFFELDPQNDLNGTTYYSMLSSGLSYEHHVGDGDPPERWTIGLELKRILG